MPALVVLTLVLKVPIHAPKIGVLGDRFDPQNGEPYERDPKRHSSAQKHVVIVGPLVRARREPKK